MTTEMSAMKANSVAQPSSSSRSSILINQAFSQLGVSFVKDRTACRLPACEASSAPQLAAAGAAARLRSRKRPAAADDSLAHGEDSCAVCQDWATGRHYGAVTCDWCKEFFELSASGQWPVSGCHFSRACDLRLQRRNHCQGCRWDKCLKAGMVATAVESKKNADADVDSGQTAGRRSPLRDLLVGAGEMPISADAVRAALTPLECPETLGARQAELERSCLVELFRWNVRRSELCGGDSDGDGSRFGDAAANWMPILLSSAARCHLAGLSGASPADALADRLRALLCGREFEFKPLLDGGLDFLMKHIGDLCNDLLNAVSELKRDVLREVALMMGDQTEEEMLACLTDSNQSAVLGAARAIVSAAARLRSARPEHRALLLAALVSEAPGKPGNWVATGGRPSLLSAAECPECGVPSLIGL